MYFASESLYEGHKHGIESEVSDTARPQNISVSRVGRPQTSSSPLVIFIAGRPKVALLFWFFGDFRCGVLLFMVIHVIYKYKNR